MSDLDPKTKKRIDDMSYADMLRIYRFSVAGHYLFCIGSGAAGYFCNLMQERKAQLSNEEQALASKRVGWEGDPISD